VESELRHWRSPIILASIGSCLIWPASTAEVNLSASRALLAESPGQISQEPLHQIARSITIKVFATDALGSGILIKKQGSVYTVLTNAHVLRAGIPPYRIQTPDGRIYIAELPSNILPSRLELKPQANSASPLKGTKYQSSVHFSGLELFARKFISGGDFNFGHNAVQFQLKSTAKKWPTNLSKYGGEYDLALLHFRSDNFIYPVALLGTSARVGEKVFAAGFPFVENELTPSVYSPKQEGYSSLIPGVNPSISPEKTGEVSGFKLTKGNVSLVLNKALEGGYQIGYTNDIEKGMSGGPLLNHRGEVIGINGKHAYPLWDAPSVFQDGSTADPKLQKLINEYSWAVPIEKVVKFLPNT
jgi:S1-C subfamily serine protease